MVSITSLVWFVFWVFIIGAIIWLLQYAIDYAEIKDPYRKVAKIVVMVGGIFVLISLLLGLVGGPTLIRFN